MKHGLSAGGRSPGPNVSPDGSVRASFAFLALIGLAVFVAAFPLVSLALLTGVVALAVLARSLARHVDREAVGRVSLPGLGTVEYRFTRS
ncbi:hypothetical protein CK500_13540 [Halorubrum salipaludis]|uniref:Uncharacterized protein n=1 Tax=Halorubrum salipaludis TaxID=2032630 RepID=A0A2A2FDG0_9EURY|nr:MULTISPECIES: hypothetical protein [Halorubrum]PAU82615.1 hypothetical protein CK500_13540 [Halorubrum salipaludis]